MLRTFSKHFFYNILFKAAREHKFTKSHFDEYVISVIISRSNTKVDQYVENLATSLIISF